MVLFRSAALELLLPTVGEDTAGVRECSLVCQAGAVPPLLPLPLLLLLPTLAPSPDDDEPADEFRLGAVDDVGERLIRLLIELDSREIVSKLSGMG